MIDLNDKIEAIIASPICKRVTVVGMGKSGIAAALFCHQLKMDVTVSDRTPYQQLDLHELEAKCGITYDLGQHTEKYFTNTDLIVLSPGIPDTIPPLMAAKAAGVPILGELEWASSFFKGQIIAITGSNGKTTTTSLIGHLLKGSGYNVFVGGNIGIPLSRALLEENSYDYAVIECSSFMLETTRHFHPHVAVWTNLSPNHLDRYPSMTEYGAAKRRLLELQNSADYAILNGNDKLVLAQAENTPAQKIYFGRQLSGKPALEINGDELHINDVCGITKSVDMTHPVLVGGHNRENGAAAIGAALLVGADLSKIMAAYPSFGGIEHRLEPVGTFKGLTFYNDSKATSDQAAATALTALKGPVILLAGGKDKGGGYAATKEACLGKAKEAILFGAAAQIIAESLKDVTKVSVVTTMEEALDLAVSHGEKGDKILLSPACSSYDQFKNFEVRGAHFKDLVKAWGNK